MLSEFLRREPKWVLAVEERCKVLVLGKNRGTSHGLKVHVFCHMTKAERDAVRSIVERWKLSVKTAGWEPKRFIAENTWKYEHVEIPPMVNEENLNRWNLNS